MDNISAYEKKIFCTYMYTFKCHQAERSMKGVKPCKVLNHLFKLSILKSGKALMMTVE